MMDCNAARLLLAFAGPLRAELDATAAADLERHLADCCQCGERALAERQFDQALSAAMRDVPDPEGGRARLLGRLQRERRAWYRRTALRAGGVLAAACLLFAVWVGLSGRGARAGINLEEAVYAINQQKGSSPLTVNDWFQETYHVRTAAPTGFNYNALAFYDLANFEGRRVPLLLFIRGAFSARVYILSDSEFNLNDVIEQPGYNIQLLRDADQPHFVYIIAYTSDRLDWFLQKDQAQVGWNAADRAAFADLR